MSRLARLDTARFQAWWAERSPRERVMLTVLAVFLGMLFLVFAVIRPIQDARARAFADIRTYETLNARLRAAGTLTPARAPAANAGTPIEAINASAARSGVVATAEPAGDGVRATVLDAGYESVIAWLSEAPLRVTRVSIQRRPAPGRVSAVVDFAP